MNMLSTLCEQVADAMNEADVVLLLAAKNYSDSLCSDEARVALDAATYTYRVKTREAYTRVVKANRDYIIKNFPLLWEDWRHDEIAPDALIHRVIATLFEADPTLALAAFESEEDNEG